MPETPDEYVFQTLLTSGIKGTKAAWPMGAAPPLPWFTYRRQKKDGFTYADDSNWHVMCRYNVDLYQKELDDSERDLFEEALAMIGPFSSYETWLTSEDCWETSYKVTYHPSDE